MRVESSVTSVSWIPSEAITGITRLGMDIGIGHYDPPPPDHVDDDVLDRLQEADALRAANRLAAWIEVDDGRIVDAGYSGRAVIGSTTAKFGPAKVTFPGVAYPVLRDEPTIANGVARFVQTVGARTGAPLPHRTEHRPFLSVTGPTTWVTLALEIGVDESVRHEVVGAAPFPRHWIYDADGSLVAKTGVIDWTEWTRVHDHAHSPWHGVQHEAVIAAAEAGAERQLSGKVMLLKPKIRKVAAGGDLVVQGEAGEDVYLVLDGMLEVLIDGRPVAEIGPGAIVGELASLQEGVRTATVRAATTAKVAAVSPSALSEQELLDVAAGHRTATS